MSEANYPTGLFMVKLRDGLGTYEHGPCKVGPSGEVVFAETNSPIKPQIVSWRSLTYQEATKIGGKQVVFGDVEAVPTPSTKGEQ